MLQNNYDFHNKLNFNDGIDIVKAEYQITNVSLIDLAIEDTLKLNRGDKIRLSPGTSFTDKKFILENLYFRNEGNTTSFSGFLIQEFDN